MSKLHSMIIGIFVGVILTSGVVFGEQISKTAEVVYNNIKIYIDGAEIVPKDADGNKVEPFIIDGTTYLPVRAISNALGKDVEWDGTTQSVYIGKKDQTKPDNYLDNIQYNDYQEGYKSSDFAVINGTITDYKQNTYKNGLIFFNYNWWEEIEDDSDESNFILSYPLNSEYKKLKGKIVLPKEYDIADWGKGNCDTDATDVWFYGDGKLLYKATKVTSSMPFNFDININGVNQLVIKIKTDAFSFSYTALTDLALYK